MHSKGAEHRNIETVGSDISVRCTWRTANESIFYKYFAALPLTNKEG